MIKYCFLIIALISACQNKPKEQKTVQYIQVKDSIIEPQQFEAEIFINKLEDSILFQNIATLVPNVIHEIRYADTNNFTRIQIYECPACFLQNDAAFALQKAQELAEAQKLSLKVFDCYRAYDYQVKLYNTFPDLNYVAKPSKGSMHSVGCAVDLTLVDSLGVALDMGTEFDSFDQKSHSYNTDIDSLAQNNRKLLRTIMNEVGFKEIRTEWWHFSFKNCSKKVDNNLKWTCE